MSRMSTSRRKRDAYDKASGITLIPGELTTLAADYRRSEQHVWQIFLDWGIVGEIPAPELAEQVPEFVHQWHGTTRWAAIPTGMLSARRYVVTASRHLRSS